MTSSNKKAYPFFLSADELCMTMAVLKEASETLKELTPKELSSLTAENLDLIAGSLWRQMDSQKEPSVRKPRLQLVI